MAFLLGLLLGRGGREGGEGEVGRGARVQWRDPLRLGRAQSGKPLPFKQAFKVTTLLSTLQATQLASYSCSQLHRHISTFLMPPSTDIPKIHAVWCRRRRACSAKV